MPDAGSSGCGFLYDVNGSWNFGQRQFFNTRISPYLTIGAGGLTAEIKDAASTYIRSDGVKFADRTLVPSGRSILRNDGDTFLAVNYGGGIKAMNLWGPMGLWFNLEMTVGPAVPAATRVNWEAVEDGTNAV